MGKGIRHEPAFRLMANVFKFLLHLKEFEIGCKFIHPAMGPYFCDSTSKY